MLQKLFNLLIIKYIQINFNYFTNSKATKRVCGSQIDNKQKMFLLD
jgi:hypothetical protein